jgi:hypothetical protein
MCASGAELSVSNRDRVGACVATLMPHYEPIKATWTKLCSKDR